MMAEHSDTTIVNALTTPTVAAVHDHTRFPLNVVISDPASFARKRAAMIAAGHSQLQVIADFDRTLSAFMTSNGSMCKASHQLLESCVGFDNTTFKPKMDSLNAHFFALEISHDITEEQRAGFMMEWWTRAHDLLLEQNIHRDTIAEAVSRSRADGTLELRRGSKQFLHLLESHSIPALVFSAGLKETIRQTLDQESLLLSNLHLIGNEMVFAEDTGLLTRFTEDVITSSNKNYSHVRVQAPAFHEEALARRHVILIGDNLGDAGMAAGMDDALTVLRVGILLDKVDARLEQFKAAFDVVLLNDPDWSFVQGMVEEIIAGKPRNNGEAAPTANGVAAAEKLVQPAANGAASATKPASVN